MGRTIIITCMNAPYLSPKNQGEEIWAVNRAFQAPTLQPNIDRVYFADSLPSLIAMGGDTFLDELNALNCPVYCQEAYPEVPMSRPIPIAQMVRQFRAFYYTSTLAYMIAHAIFERVNTIVLHHVNSATANPEYYHQKACNDFWCGVALGLGIRIRARDTCLLMKPHPWESPLYGYWRGPKEADLYGELNGAVANLMSEPIRYQEVKYVEGVSPLKHRDSNVSYVRPEMETLYG